MSTPGEAKRGTVIASEPMASHVSGPPPVPRHRQERDEEEDEQQRTERILANQYEDGGHRGAQRIRESTAEHARAHRLEHPAVAGGVGDREQQRRC
mgnify:CR=1 FL=1